MYGTANGKDLVNLAACARNCRSWSVSYPVFPPEMRDIAEMDTPPILWTRWTAPYATILPSSVREGGILRPGYSERWTGPRRAGQRRQNGVRAGNAGEGAHRLQKPKVGFNKVFGYYIDVPNSAGLTEVPEDYIRKQTLVSNERYFTQELKELENTLLTAKDRIADLGVPLFDEVRALRGR